MDCSTEMFSVEQKLRSIHELQKCIQLSRLCKNIAFEEFYYNKLKDIET